MRRASHIIPSLKVVNGSQHTRNFKEIAHRDVKLREMRRKGQEMGLNKVFAMILLLACLGLVIWGVYGKGFANITYLAKLLPGFNETIPEGTSIVGVNLETNDLMYFTGEKWRKIDFSKPDDKFVMGGYEFKPQEMNDKLRDYYFNTKRKPEQFNLEVNHWRYWVIYQELSSTVIIPYTKDGFVGPPKSSYDHNFAILDAKVSYNDLDKFKYGKGSYLVSFSILDLFKSSSVFNKIIGWRDGIFEGGKCEKFLKLNIDEKKQGEKDKDYTVRKVDNYIFVDLGKEISGGNEQRYNDKNCLGIEDYKDTEDRSKWKNDADITIKYSFTYHAPGLFGQLSPKTVHEKARLFMGTWRYSELENDNFYKNSKDEEGYVPYSIRSASNVLPYMNLNVDNREFYDYLIKQIIPNLNSIGASFNCDDKIIQGFFIKDKKISNFGKCVEWRDMKQEEIDRLIYDLLGEYNKHLSAPVSTNSEKVIN